MFPETWRRVGSASLGEKRRCGVSPSLYFGLLGQILGPSEKQSCEMQKAVFKSQDTARDASIVSFDNQSQPAPKVGPR
jgi:hypothetical protein